MRATIRRVSPDELTRLGGLVLSEDGLAALGCARGVLVFRRPPAPRDARCTRPSDPHAEVRVPLDDQDVLFGAFDGATLVGVAILQPRIVPGVSGLVGPWVCPSHRRRGIGARLAERVRQQARAHGAELLYASSCPCESAVEFYRSCGFEPADDANQEMFALADDGVHMVRMLGPDA